MSSVYQGTVTRLEEDAVWVEIADLAIDQDFPCRWVQPNLIIGDFVLVTNIEGAQEDLVIVGKLFGDIDDEPPASEGLPEEQVEATDPVINTGGGTPLTEIDGGTF